MGVFGSFNNKKGFFVPGRNVGTFEENPVEAYEIQEPVERMVAAQKALDEKAYAFLERFQADEVFEGVLDVDGEWRCWLESDTENSCLFFDDKLEVFGDAAYDHFVDHYSKEWKELAKDAAAIEKMGKSLDEYKILKTSLYNVFNNKNRLPVREYFEQVYSRAQDYHMVLEKPSKEKQDLLVVFEPLKDVNRGNSYLNHKLYLEYNPDHKRDGYVYSVQSMESYSKDAMYAGPVDLPIYGSYSKFEKSTNAHFLEESHSLFYYDALRSHRQVEKAEHGVPADYFEGTYIDTKKLVDFSDKSYQYGNSKIFIPKSQMAIVGETVYMKRWLYYKLKGDIEKINEQDQNKEQSSLSDKVGSAEKLVKEGSSLSEKEIGEKLDR